MAQRGGVKLTFKPPDAVKARLLAARVRQQAEKAAGRGLNALRPFLLARVKETVSVPAPRKRVVPRDGSPPYYRATTRAIPGAPVRKLSGSLRMRLTAVVVGTDTLVIGCNAKSPKGFSYPRYHEVVDPRYLKSGRHQYVRPTVEKYRREIVKVLGTGFRTEVGKGT